MLTPLLQATLMKVAQALARQYGRCFIAMTFKWIGISFMLIMIFMAAHTSLTTPICVALVFRTAFMNSTNALTKSVLMDHVPKKERAKWSALESFNMFSWSGSAALGGILVDYHGILFNFCITAGLQFLATIPHFLLAMSVNKRPVSTTATSTNMDSTN
jgi:predicted MFS family arabinose efflux permease